MTSHATTDRRILVVAPTGMDAKNSVDVLQGAGFHAQSFGNVASAVEEAFQGCGVLLLTEEALSPAQRNVLATMLATQPKWSNVPVVLIASSGTENISRDIRRGFDPKVPITLLERPLRTTTLIAAVEAALGSRDQQYEIRDLWEEREEMLNSLEERVEERTAKLQTLVQEMEAFSYSVSHDLRAPLRVISGYADAVHEDYGHKLPAEGHRLLDKISRAATRMDRLTQDLLAYTRIANGEIALELMDLDTIVDGVIEAYPSIQEAKDYITFQRPLGKCMGHAPSLQQCFSNLLENAIKFARPGEPPQIEIFTTVREDRLRISVRDHGIGIDPRDAERIFGLFERGGGNYPGTGIGLAIVKKGAERMKGKVGFTSVHGQKTEFWIELKMTR